LQFAKSEKKKLENCKAVKKEERKIEIAVSPFGIPEKCVLEFKSSFVPKDRCSEE
jgi:hypothetical protein